MKPLIDIFDDNLLSLSAKGLYSTLHALDIDERAKISVKDLAAMASDNEEDTERYLSELQEAGYIK